MPEADVTRIAVGGDSAGGNLAAAVSLLVRDRGGPRLTGQLLVYPNTDYPPPRPPAEVDPLLFNELSVRWYWQNYLADEADGRPRSSSRQNTTRCATRVSATPAGSRTTACPSRSAGTTA